MRKYLFIIMALWGVYLNAQTVNWTDVTASYQLPAGIKCFKGVRTSPALTAFYLDVDMNQPNLTLKAYLSPVGSETINSFVSRYNAIAGVNGGYFSGTSSYSTVIQPNTVLAKNIASVTRNTNQTFYTVRSLFSISDTRDMAVNWIYHFGNSIKDIYSYAAPLPNTTTTPAPAPLMANGKILQDVLTGIGGAPTLVKNGVAAITYNEEVMFGSGVGLTELNPRTAVGYTANKHAILLVVDGRQTASVGISLPDLAQMLISLGCVEAMNLDGGGSTQMAIGGNYVNVPSESRPVVTMLAVVKADSLPVLPPVYYKKIIDTENADCSLVGSGWKATGSSGYYGASPSMFTYAGTGSEYAVYKPKVKKSAQYDVYAWWTANSFRAQNTPFVINRKQGVDTVRIDQTINGSKWNKIGTYTFAGDTNDAVIISNNAQTGTIVIADAIRVLSFDSLATGVTDTAPRLVPESGELLQNYPNPFNPATVIRYAVSQSSMVSLKVFDVLGREVAELVHEQKAPGTYEAAFNAGNLSSGVYVYQLTAGSYSAARKLVVVK